MAKTPHYGPTRGELWLRLAVSLGGLAMLGALLALRGIPTGPGLVEVLVIPLLFFGGTLFLSARRLICRDHPSVDEDHDGL